MSVKKQYRLLKDLPDAKAGDFYCHNGSGHYLHMTSPSARSWGRKEVEGLSDWFEPITPQQETQDGWHWTDELVGEYGEWYRKEQGNGWKYLGWDRIEAFKDYKGFPSTKQQPNLPKEERIEVKEIYEVVGIGFMDVWTKIKTSIPIPKKKYPLIKEAIEFVLNNNVSLEAAVSVTKNMKSYTQSQLEEAEENAFVAGWVKRAENKNIFLKDDLRDYKNSKQQTKQK